MIGKMLVRDPSGRASLADITSHPWMMMDEAGTAASRLVLTPLVCRETLTDDDHWRIVQRIVDGKIATKEDIIKSLEMKAYDHITATYYLLAERLLRKRADALQASAGANASAAEKGDVKPALSPLALSPRQPVPPHQMDLDSEISAVGRHADISSIQSLVSPGDGPIVSPAVTTAAAAAASGTAGGAGLHSEIGLLMCRCTMIHEDSLEAYDNDADDANVTTIDQSHSDSELVADESPVGEEGMEPSFGSTLEVPTSVHAGSLGSRPLVSVRSSPQLLNEICEETETADDEDPISAVAMVQTHTSRRSSTEQSRHLDRLHRVHRRKMAVPRVASCSSSDTSDTDEIVDQNKQRKQKPSAAAAPPANVKHLGRRDSSEHSSDNDSQPCGSYPATGSGVSTGVHSGATRRSSDSQCGNNQQGQGSNNSGRTKRAESEHSYQRRALNMCRTSGRCNSAVITNWKSLDSQLVLQLFSDCYSEEAEDEFCDYTAQLDRDWIMNARNQLSNLIQLHSEDSRCMTDSFDPSLIDGLLKWCTDGRLQTGKYNMTDRVNSNSVTVLTGVGCRDPLDSRLRARKVSL